MFNEKYGKFYTVTPQKALLETNGKPILLNVRIEDIYIKNQKYFAKFSSVDYFSNLNPGLFYDFECDKKLVQILLENPKPTFTLSGFKQTRVAVVAKIEDVQRMDFTLSGNKETDQLVKIDASTFPYLIKEKCLDLRILSMNENQWLDESPYNKWLEESP